MTGQGWDEKLLEEAEKRAGKNGMEVNNVNRSTTKEERTINVPKYSPGKPMSYEKVTVLVPV